MTDWNEAIVPAVEAVCRDKLRKKALQDAQVQKAWRKFDDIGVDAVLQGKSYLEFLEQLKGITELERGR